MENIEESAIIETEQLKTTNFSSITQYDKQFDELFTDPSKKGFACSFFSLIAAWKFINGEIPDIISHETTIAQSLLAQSTCDINFGITFEEMLASYTDINPTQIYATTTDLINSGEIGFDKIFPPIVDNTKIAIIILKNERYLTILIDENGYQFRDCHENLQYNFGTFDELVIHLINSYQFTENVNAGGVEYHDYSSIEFLILNSPFYLSVTDMLGITAKKPINVNENMFNIPEETTLSADEICYLEMLNAEINETSNAIYDDDVDIPIQNLGDFSGDNNVPDIEFNDDYVEFE